MSELFASLHTSSAKRTASASANGWIPLPSKAERREPAEDQLHQLHTAARVALEMAGIGVWEWDFAAHKLTWDARMYEIYGITPGAPIDSERWKRAVHPQDLDQASGVFARVEQQGLQGKHQFRIVHPIQGVRYIETTEQLVLNSAGKPIACVGIDQDVTERRRAHDALLDRQAELEKLTLTDPLTGVGNRRKLDEDIAREVSRVRRYGGKLSFLIADVDRFKAINDACGHEAGDAVLRGLAQALRANVRDTDLVARYGGDEFCVVMPATELEDAHLVAKRIQARLEQAIVPALGRAMCVSMGVAELAADESAESLLGRADSALLRAKRRGRNRVVSDLGNDRRSNRGHQAEAEARRPSPRTVEATTAATVGPTVAARVPVQAPLGLGAQLLWLSGGAPCANLQANAPACPPPFN
jgi:diguanylate cyclase (GGDEF)-like protein